MSVPKNSKFLSENSEILEKVLKSRFFLSQTASIYGGVAGLYDLGPHMFGLKQKLLEIWRNFFVIEENLLEIESSTLLPYNVLKASGHVDRFCDILICDSITQSSYRADHFISEFLSKLKPTEEIINIINNIDCMNCNEIDEIIQKFKISSPEGNPFSKAINFNLMFSTSLGFNPGQQAFLRPETAQGQFLNFKKLYEYNFRKFPFGSATIGKAFRNEISPRSGLLRVREFDQAEIEFFVSPGDKKFSKFKEIKDLKIPLKYDVKREEGSKEGGNDDLNEVKDTNDDSNINSNNDPNDLNITPLSFAIDNKIIANETLGYFMGRTYLFLLEIGINPNLMRFRQHKKDEMAHYATDCWDCELYSSSGWIECIGIADRSAYDLTSHSKATKVDLSYKKILEDPYEISKWTPVPDKKKLIKILKNKYEKFKNEIEEIGSEWINENKKAVVKGDDIKGDVKGEDLVEGLSNLNTNLDTNNQHSLPSLNSYYITHVFEGTPFQIEVQLITKKVTEENIIPDVIEPSFGIGRILTILLEQTFYIRDSGRTSFKLPFCICPTKVMISYLIYNEEYESSIKELEKDFKNENLGVMVNQRGCSIGKKYVYADELGIPYFITFDEKSIKTETVTIRERDSMKQIRVKVKEVVEIIKKMIKEKKGISEYGEVIE
ncbi:Glycyl-tRNA synthetase [Nosema bombycis CQ1]|uniref:glycine--tRNA ligase n=1 Tax=Nosema bombycis (strain CQ1 / CVCC 102059) TaxID=578461 RepID=R0MBR1_NOSB1|nr:Glycyl-tRNA synthetase [Nosema bombycis CQ1]|eukprot:EOB11475.1 Glycyl-tRNA synthetase [Nosema bombycis CQ1]